MTKGVALILLMLTETMTFILIWVGVLAFGMALLFPTLATLASRRSETEVGTALGLQTLWAFKLLPTASANSPGL